MLSETIKTFIESQIQLHPQIEPWLADWSLDHETQINIDTAGLEPCYGGRHAAERFKQGRPTHWVDDEGTEHRQIRIPNTDKETGRLYYKDHPVYGPVHKRWQYIGTSGWNWREKKSMWVGYDFDSVANHSGGLDPDRLTEIRDRVLELPYATLRTSKSGKGYHVLVPLNPWATTLSHKQHSLLAEQVLGRMSRDCDFDFHGSVDCCGLILWHFERGLQNGGLRGVERVGTRV